MSRIPFAADELMDELRARAAGSTSPVSVSRRSGRLEIVFRLLDADRLGVLLEEIEVRRTDDGGDSADLDRQAQAVMEKVTALGDRLALLELEPRLGRAVLRSSTPRRLPDGLEYDELQLDGGRRASLKRYRFDRADGRHRAVPANLAAEVVPRVARELLEALEV